MNHFDSDPRFPPFLQYVRCKFGVTFERRSSVHFFSKTARLSKAKLYAEPPWEGRMLYCINGPGHMTKMAAKPIYGKNLQKLFSSELEVR